MMQNYSNEVTNFMEYLVYKDYHCVDRASQASLQCSQGEDYK
jgi:hypothetical protein